MFRNTPSETFHYVLAEFSHFSVPILCLFFLFAVYISCSSFYVSK